MNECGVGEVRCPVGAVESGLEWKETLLYSRSVSVVRAGYCLSYLCRVVRDLRLELRGDLGSIVLCNLDFGFKVKLWLGCASNLLGAGRESWWRFVLEGLLDWLFTVGSQSIDCSRSLSFGSWGLCSRGSGRCFIVSSL